MKRIVAIGSPNIIEILMHNLGDDYIIENGNYRGTVHESRRRLLHFIHKMIKSDIVYFLFISDFTNILAFFARLMGKKVVYHWLGTDVWNCLQGKSNAYNKPWRAHLHFAYALNLQQELRTLGVDSAVYPLSPEGLSMRMAKMPEHHAVLVSIPDISKDFYGYKTLKEVIKRFPELPFYIVRSTKPEYYPEDNVHFMGLLSREEMDRLFDKISIVFRYPDHDGLSLIMMEATIKGKVMVYRFDHPFAYKVGNTEEICQTLTEVLRSSPSANVEAHSYGVEQYSKETCRSRGIELLQGLEA